MMVLRPPPCGWSTQCGAVLQLMLSLLHLCLYQAVLLSQETNAQECITPNVFPYPVTELLKKEISAKMFYQCYSSESQTQHLQLNIHLLKFHGPGEEMMIYTDATPKVINTDCGGCSKPKPIVNNPFQLNNLLSFFSDNSEVEVTEPPYLGNEECQICDTILNGSLFEIYSRVSSSSLCETDEGECQNNVPEYNMTFSLVDNDSSDSQQSNAPGCDEGQLVSFPLGSESCVVNVSSPNSMKQQCMLNTCSKENVSPDKINEKTEHKFLPSVKSEFCVWELDTHHRKHIFLEFSKDVKPHITIFEHTLLEPVRNLEWCPIFGNNQYQMETKADKVFIVYNRQESLNGKGSISIRLQADLCPLPPPINHGIVEFLRQETGTKAIYRCDNGFEILGKTEIVCTNEAWEEPPVCLPTEKSLGIGQKDEGELEIELTKETSHGNEEDLKEELHENDLHDEVELKVKIDKSFKPDDIGSQDPTVTPLEEDIIKVEEDIIREDTDISNIAIQSGNENEKEDINQITSDDTNGESDGTKVRIDVVDDEDSEINVIEDVYEESNLQENSTLGLEEVDKENNGFSIEILNFRLEEEMLYYVIGGAAVLLLIIIICCISCCVYRRGKSGIGKRFDTFQNPIYEKSVVRMPMQQPETVVDVEREKMDLEEISDCTVLE